MKKSKLTGTLAVGGGLKHAVVPYIITGEENNKKVLQCVFDTTLGKPIWCKTAKTDTTAAICVDSTGATV